MLRIGGITLAFAACAVAAPPLQAAGPTGQSLPGTMTSKAPWGPNNQFVLGARLEAIGLPALTAEGVALHIHQHIDLFVNGRGIQLPAGIGIDDQGKFISELHTHDGSGIVHVEAPRVRAFSLGEFFDVWGLRLSKDCIGGHCARNGNRLWIWVNGKRWRQEPRAVPLTRHAEIVIAFGTFKELPRTIAKSFLFPQGM